MKDRKPNGYWNKTNILKEAKKYKKRDHFREKSGGAYNAATRKRILNEVCKHMDKKRFWDEKSVKKEALKYDNRSDFHRNSFGAYRKAKKLGILDKICKHMKIKGNKLKRMLYVFEFPDKSAYIGLTYDYDKRYKEHMRESKKIIEKTEELGHEFIMFNEFFSIDIVGKMERDLIKSYKEKGWNVLNRKRGGALGSSVRKWTEENIREEALKYKGRLEFSLKSSAYQAAIKNNILDSVCSHMKRNKRLPGYWSKENIFKESNKYSSRVDFEKNSGGAYNAARRLGVLDEVCSHMIKKKQNGQKKI